MTTQDRLESARDGLEGVLGTLQPGWIQALDRHALDSIALLGRAAVEACGEITRDLAADGDRSKDDDVELRPCASAPRRR